MESPRSLVVTLKSPAPPGTHPAPPGTHPGLEEDKVPEGVSPNPGDVRVVPDDPGWNPERGWVSTA